MIRVSSHRHPNLFPQVAMILFVVLLVLLFGVVLLTPIAAS